MLHIRTQEKLFLINNVYWLAVTASWERLYLLDIVKVYMGIVMNFIVLYIFMFHNHLAHYLILHITFLQMYFYGF